MRSGLLEGGFLAAVTYLHSVGFGTLLLPKLGSFVAEAIPWVTSALQLSEIKARGQLEGATLTPGTEVCFHIPEGRGGSAMSIEQCTHSSPTLLPRPSTKPLPLTSTYWL